VDRGTCPGFTFGSNAYMPIWSPDGSRIVFSARDPHVSRYQILQKSVGGTQQLLYETAAANVYPYDWSSDGKFVVYGQDAEQTRRDLWIMPWTASTNRSCICRLHLRDHPQFSPDGNGWLTRLTSPDKAGLCSNHTRGPG